jgi:two-component system OmpR family sensor kinase
LFQHEKKAFLKFFITYFVSVALLILVAGFFYFKQGKNHLLKSEEFSLIEYARHIKMKQNLKKFSKDYHFIIVKKDDNYIDIRNFKRIGDEFTKYLPTKSQKFYLQVFKSTKSFDDALWHLKLKIISIQLLLVLLFAFISYMLAKSALKPLQKSITTLDKFAKDLIHDLNTPVTSIKLNIKLLEKSTQLQDKKVLERLKKSAHTISELHENLTTLLQEKTFQVESINLYEIIHDITDIQKSIYPDINFIIKERSFIIKSNKNAIKQLLQNIISNACKYNKKGGFIKIYNVKQRLYIQDSGRGIAEPNKIFQRAYSESKSSGIGLDIVKRLAEAMKIKIEVESTLNRGTTFILTIT